MPQRLCRRARCVPGTPSGVIAWIDHEQQPDVLLLNADCFTPEQERAITNALNQGNYTGSQVIAALAPTGG